MIGSRCEIHESHLFCPQLNSAEKFSTLLALSREFSFLKLRVIFVFFFSFIIIIIIMPPGKMEAGRARQRSLTITKLCLPKATHNTQPCIAGIQTSPPITFTPPSISPTPTWPNNFLPRRSYPLLFYSPSPTITNFKKKKPIFQLK